MEQKKKDQAQPQKTQPVTYYGKKAYRIHPLLARVKPVAAKLPDYRQQKLDDKSERSSNS